MSKKWTPKQVKLDKKGIAKFLGERESQVMEVLWGKERASVRDVCGELCKKRDFSFNTIMTIMNRLAEKGLLVKETKNGIYCYYPRYSKQDFTSTIASTIFTTLLKDANVFDNHSLTKALNSLPRDKQNEIKKILS